MDEKSCRICFEDENSGGILIKPCKCNQPIHKKCLKMWIKIKINPCQCEICKAKYKVDFTIIPIQETIIILDENIFLFILNNKKIIFITVLFALIFIILIYIVFDGNHNIPSNLSIPNSRH